MELRTYTSADWPSIREFIHTHWRAGHPYTDRKLFEWQFRGFGPDARPIGRMMVHEGEVVGFLGATPGEYFVDAQILPGAVFDLWVVRPDFRNRALGLLLMRAIEDEFSATCCLGVNPDVVRFYTSRGYGHAERLNRYVSVLDARRFQTMLSAGGGEPLRMPPVISLLSCEPREPGGFPNLFELQALYARTVERVFRYGLHRSAAFWKWRYVQSAGFKYLTWGDPYREGLIVARVERIMSPDSPDVDGLPVLRIIELLPASKQAWEGATYEPFLRLLRGTLAWAAQQGCLLADYQNSSSRLATMLRAAGFQEPDVARSGVVARTPNLFQPLRFDAAPINYVWRVADGTSGGSMPVPDDIYFVKSDNGMDRPNVWPIPAAYDPALMADTQRQMSYESIEVRREQKVAADRLSGSFV